MNRKDIPAVALLMGTTAMLGAAVYFSAPAHADVDQAVINYAARYAPAVCSTLDDYPTFNGIVGIGQAIVEDGFTYRDAGQVIALSVATECPRHAALLKRFVDAPTPSSANTKVA